MPASTVDLKSLLFMIRENKDVEANLILDEGCFLETDDIKPLVKVINYILNYLQQITDKPIEVGLDLRGKDYLMNFLAYTGAETLPELSDQLEGALSSYDASLEKKFEAGKNVQLKIHFRKN
jgi:hypothetical protein